MYRKFVFNTHNENKSIAFFRLIDYWVGIPCCFVCTLFDYLKRAWRRVIGLRPSAPRNILVIKISELGAMVYAYPFFRKLNEDYPNAKVYVLTFHKNREIFESFDEFIRIEELITVRDQNLIVLAQDLWRALLAFHRLKFDICIDLEFFSRISALLAFFSDAPKKAGFYPYGYEGLYRGDFLTHKVCYNPLKHVSINFLSLLASLDRPRKDTPEMENNIVNSYPFPAYSSKEKIRRGLARFQIPHNKVLYLLNPGEGTIPVREWPLENFKQVCEFILDDEKNILLLVGAADSNIKSSWLMQEIKNERMKNLCGQTNFKELMELFLMSRLLIANDGGLPHFAVLTGLETIVFFGPETPQVFGPLSPRVHVCYSRWPCSPCLSAFNHRNSACQDNQCLKAIKPEDVIQLIKNTPSTRA